MLRTGMLRLLRTPNIQAYQSISISLRYTSSQNVHKSLPSVDEIFAKDRRPIQPFVEDPIIVKKFFVSEVDSEQMLYPEVISKDELDALIKHNQYVWEYFGEGIELDGKGYSSSAHEAFKQMGLYGYNVPKKFGGRDYTYTETSLASEAEAQNTTVAMAMNAHRLVCGALNEFGTDKQQAEYLPKLGKGDMVATTAFQEWNKNEIIANHTTAEYDADKNQWRLNGVKSFVVNAAKSNLFMVLAQVPQSSKTDSLAIFLVDSSLPGVSVHKKDDTIGLKHLYQSEISFKDVHLSAGFTFGNLFFSLV